MATIEGFFTKAVSTSSQQCFAKLDPKTSVSDKPSNETGEKSPELHCKHVNDNTTINTSEILRNCDTNIIISNNSTGDRTSIVNDTAIAENKNVKKNLKRTSSQGNRLTKKRCRESIKDAVDDTTTKLENVEVDKQIGNSVTEISYSDFIKSLEISTAVITSSCSEDIQVEEKGKLGEASCSSADRIVPHKSASLKIINNLNNLIPVEESVSSDVSASTAISGEAALKESKIDKKAKRSRKSSLGKSVDKGSRQNKDLSCSKTASTDLNEKSPCSQPTQNPTIRDTEECNKKTSVSVTEDCSNDATDLSPPESKDIRSFFNSVFVRSSKPKVASEIALSRIATVSEGIANASVTATNSEICRNIENNGNGNVSTIEKSVIESDHNKFTVSNGAEEIENLADLSVPPCKDIRNFFAKPTEGNTRSSFSGTPVAKLTIRAEIHGESDGSMAVKSKLTQSNVAKKISSKGKNSWSTMNRIVTDADLVIECVDSEPENKFKELAELENSKSCKTQVVDSLAKKSRTEGCDTKKASSQIVHTTSDEIIVDKRLDKNQLNTSTQSSEMNETETESVIVANSCIEESNVGNENTSVAKKDYDSCEEDTAILLDDGKDVVKSKRNIKKIDEAAIELPSQKKDEFIMKIHGGPQGDGDKLVQNTKNSDIDEIILVGDDTHHVSGGQDAADRVQESSELNSSLIDFSLGLKQAVSKGKSEKKKSSAKPLRKNKLNDTARLIQSSLVVKASSSNAENPKDQRQGVSAEGVSNSENDAEVICVNEPAVVNVEDLDDTRSCDRTQYCVASSKINRNGQTELRMTFKRILNGSGGENSKKSMKGPSGKARNLRVRTKSSSNVKSTLSDESTLLNEKEQAGKKTGERENCEQEELTLVKNIDQSNVEDEALVQPAVRSSRRSAAIAAAAAINALNVKESGSKAKQKSSDSLILVGSDSESSVDEKKSDRRKKSRGEDVTVIESNSKNSGRGQKLAPLFTKHKIDEVVIPVLSKQDLEKLRLRSNFLQSGVPEELRRQQLANQSVSLPALYPDWSLNVHILQKPGTTFQNGESEIVGSTEDSSSDMNTSEALNNICTKDGAETCQELVAIVPSEAATTKMSDKEIGEKVEEASAEDGGGTIISNVEAEAVCESERAHEGNKVSSSSSHDENLTVELVSANVQTCSDQVPLNASGELNEETSVCAADDDNCKGMEVEPEVVDVESSKARDIKPNNVVTADRWNKVAKLNGYSTEAGIDCWNLPMVELRLQHNLQEHMHSLTSAKLKLGSITSVSDADCHRKNLMEKQCLLSADTVLPLLAEILSSNPRFPVHHIYSQLSARHSASALGSAVPSSSSTFVPSDKQAEENEKQKVSDCGKDDERGKEASRGSSGRVSKKQRNGAVKPTGDDVTASRSSSPRTRKSEKQKSDVTDEDCSIVVQDTNNSFAGKGESLMWTEKYAPQCSTGVIGNRKACKKLLDWLQAWKKQIELEAAKCNKTERDSAARRDSGETSGMLPESDDEFEKQNDGEWSNHSDSSYICNTVLLLGPGTGIGKTAMVYAIAQEVGFKVFEVNCTQQRDGRRLLSQLHEATQSHQVSRGSATAPVAASFNLSQAPISQPSSNQQSSSAKQKPEIQKSSQAKNAFEKMFGVAKTAPSKPDKKEKSDNSERCGTSKGKTGGVKKRKDIIELDDTEEDETEMQNVRKSRRLSLVRKSKSFEDIELKDCEGSSDVIEKKSRLPFGKEKLENSPTITEDTLRRNDSPRRKSKNEPKMSKSDSRIECMSDKKTDLVTADMFSKQSNSSEVKKVGDNKETAVSLILFDEADIVLGDDRGFWSAVETFIRETKRPIVLTASDEKFPQLFNANCMALKLYKPPAVNIASYIQILCLIENTRVSHETVLSLVRAMDCDIRRSMLTMQFWLQSHGSNAVPRPVRYLQTMFDTLQRKATTSRKIPDVADNNKTLLPGITSLHDQLVKSLASKNSTTDNRNDKVNCGNLDADCKSVNRAVRKQNKIANKLKNASPQINQSEPLVEAKSSVASERDSVPSKCEVDNPVTAADSDDEFQVSRSRKDSKRLRLRRVLSDDSCSVDSISINSAANANSEVSNFGCAGAVNWLNSEDSSSQMSMGYEKCDLVDHNVKNNDNKISEQVVESDQTEDIRHCKDMICRDDLVIPLYEAEVLLDKQLGSSVKSAHSPMITVHKYVGRKYCLHYSTSNRLVSDIMCRLDSDCRYGEKGVKDAPISHEPNVESQISRAGLQNSTFPANSGSSANSNLSCLETTIVMNEHSAPFSSISVTESTSKENKTLRFLKSASHLYDSVALLDSCFGSQLNDCSPVISAGCADEFPDENISSTSGTLTRELVSTIENLIVEERISALKDSDKELLDSWNILKTSEDCASFGRMADKNSASTDHVITGLATILPAQALAMDYMPAVRDICRAEGLRKATNTKRRFMHYLNGCYFNSSTLDTLSAAFNHL